ncbi:hypothetical protein D3C73_1223820 [compost metagenome]
MLAAVTEQMALVVVLQATVGRGEQQAVVDAPAIAQLHAADHRRVQGLGLFAHPGHGRAFYAFGLCNGLVGKATGEGFRQDHQIGSPDQRRQQRTVVVAVAGRVVPAGVALDEGNAQILHAVYSAHSRRRRSIAASRVASFLAKHRRTRRWPTGAVS